MGCVLLLWLCVFSCFYRVDCDDDNTSLITKIQQIIQAWTAIWKNTSGNTQNNHPIKPQTPIQSLRRPTINSLGLSTTDAQIVVNNTDGITEQNKLNITKNEMSPTETNSKEKTFSSSDLFRVIENKMNEYKENKKMMFTETNQSTNINTGEETKTFATIKESTDRTRISSSIATPQMNIDKGFKKIPGTDMDHLVVDGNSSIKRPVTATAESGAPTLLQKTGLTWLGKTVVSSSLNKTERGNQNSKNIKISNLTSTNHISTNKHPNLSTKHKQNIDKNIEYFSSNKSESIEKRNNSMTLQKVDESENINKIMLSTGVDSTRNVTSKTEMDIPNQMKTKQSFSISFVNTTPHIPLIDKTQGNHIHLESGRIPTKIVYEVPMVSKLKEGTKNINSLNSQSWQVSAVASGIDSGLTKASLNMAEQSSIKSNSLQDSLVKSGIHRDFTKVSPIIADKSTINVHQIYSHQLSNAMGDRVVNSTQDKDLDVAGHTSSAPHGEVSLSKSENHSINHKVHYNQPLSKDGVGKVKSYRKDAKHNTYGSATHFSFTKGVDRSEASGKDKQSNTKNADLGIRDLPNLNGSKVLSMKFKVQSVENEAIRKRISEQLLAQRPSISNLAVKVPLAEVANQKNLQTTESINSTEPGVVVIPIGRSAGFVNVDIANDPFKIKQQEKASVLSGIKNMVSKNFITTQNLLQKRVNHGVINSINSLTKPDHEQKTYPSWGQQISANIEKLYENPLQSNQRNDSRRTRPFPMRKIIQKSKTSQQTTQSKTDVKKTALSTNKKPTTDTTMKQSITNFGNNRLLFNEFRKFKLRTRARKRRSLLSSYAQISQQPDSPVTLFRNSYHTIVGLPKDEIVNIRYNSPPRVKESIILLSDTLTKVTEAEKNRNIKEANTSKSFNSMTKFTDRTKLKRHLTPFHDKNNSIYKVKRNHKKRHIKDTWYQRISKTLSNGLTVFPKKQSFIQIINRKQSTDKTLQVQTDIKRPQESQIMQYSSHKIYPNKDKSQNVHVKTNSITDKQHFLGSYHRQQRMHVDSGVSKVPQNSQIPNQKVDFISNQMVPQITVSNQTPVTSMNFGNQVTNKVSPFLGDSRGGEVAWLLANKKFQVDEGRISKGFEGKPNTVQPTRHLNSLLDGRTIRYGLTDSSRNNIFDKPQRHHGRISNSPNLISQLSNMNDIVSENGYHDYSGDISSDVLSKVKSIVTDVNAPSDFVMNDFDKTIGSELLNVLNLQDIKIVPGGYIIQGTFYRFEDIPKSVRDVYDAETKHEQVKISLSDVDHILNDYTDNKGSISQGFVRVLPMLRVNKGANTGPFSMQNQVDNTAYDMLADPNLHEGSLERAMLHAKSFSAHNSNFKDGLKHDHRDSYPEHKGTKSKENQVVFRSSLKWSDGIPDKAGTGLGSLSDYHLGAEVRVGSSLSLGKSPPVIHEQKTTQSPPIASSFVAFKKKGERQILSLPHFSKTIYNNYNFGNLDHPVSKTQQTDKTVPAYKTGKQAVNVVQPHLRPRTSPQIDHYTKHYSYKSPTSLNDKGKRSKNNKMFENKRNFVWKQDNLSSRMRNALNVDKSGTRTFYSVPRPNDSQHNDIVTSKIDIKDKKKADSTDIYLNPKLGLFSGLKVIHKTKPNLSLEKSNMFAQKNSIVPSFVRNFDHYNSRDFFG